MSDFLFPPPAPPSVTIAGRSERFAVRRIFCVGRNYAEHAREMGSDPEREPPFFFCKPADAVFEPERQGPLPWPGATADLQHEVEWVLALGAPLREASAEQAAAAVWGHAVGVDLTRRDLQAAAKKAGGPWDLAKGFDNSALIGPLVELAGELPGAGAIELDLNGNPRQRGDLAEMIWSAPALLAELSRFVALRAGDLVYTGTPAGVGPLRPGDRLSARIAGLPELRMELADV